MKKEFKEPEIKLIKGVEVKDLKVFPDERGRLIEIFRDDDELFIKFGQAYVTTAYPGVVKAWHLHEKQTDHIVCVHGMIKLVLYDVRGESPTLDVLNEFYLGVHHPILVKVPPLVYHGFKGVSVEEAIVVNIPDAHYDYKKPDEFRLDAYNEKINYDWRRKDR